MNYPIYQADAFTATLFGGNPAAVCPLDEWLPEAVMQKIAAENNLAETAFFVREENGFFIRWFTPECEIDLCGHATLASAHILYTELAYSAAEINFQTLKAGKLTVFKENDLYTLDFPSRTPEYTEVPAPLLEALGNQKVVEVLKSGEWYVVVFENEQEIAALNPDFALLKHLGIAAVVVTAPGDDSDFVSRMFAPALGIPEDPVTGSAHCILVPYWAKQFGRNNLHAFQISSRKGELWCELKGNRVLMAGKAVTYLKGEIYI